MSRQFGSERRRCVFFLLFVFVFAMTGVEVLEQMSRRAAAEWAQRKNLTVDLSWYVEDPFASQRRMKAAFVFGVGLLILAWMMCRSQRKADDSETIEVTRASWFRKVVERVTGKNTAKECTTGNGREDERTGS